MWAKTMNDGAYCIVAITLCLLYLQHPPDLKSKSFLHPKLEV